MIVTAKGNNLVVVFGACAAPVDIFSAIPIRWRAAARILAYMAAGFAAASVVACITYRVLFARKSDGSSMGDWVKHA
jgi:hypothetical protein